MKANNHAEMEARQFVIIGGGPAGLTAAYELTKLGLRTIVLEKADKVGGISRTENYKNYYFDMGGHRFFTKVEQVNKIWLEVLGEDFLKRPRLSRIYYNRKFFRYPLKPFNALAGLGVVQSILVALSYIRWQLFPFAQEDTFEQWVVNRFGKRLFLTFFKSYTEKVWGIPTTELRAEFAAQRIKDLDLKTALISMFVKPGNKIKTLIEEFHYPRRGPGMMWTAVKERIERQNGTVSLNTCVVKINREGDRITSVVARANGQDKAIPGTDFISSMPLSEFINKLDPPAPPAIREAANRLRYRDFLTVCVIVNKANLFLDNWIYVHDPTVKVGRIQNYKNWSADMVPDPNRSSLGLEYFCQEGDQVWSMPDADLIELAKHELHRIGLANYEDVEDGCVYRVEKAYPIYASDYEAFLEPIKEYVGSLKNFQTIGRNGLHRYNNQDHAMLTGMLAMRNLVFGEKNNLWKVNAEQEYHEAVQAHPGVEVPDVTEVIQGAFNRVFQKLDPLAFALSLGLTLGMTLCLATLVLTLKGGAVVGPNLKLLGEFLPGYTVTVAGSLVGLAYGFMLGVVGGGSFAYLRNMMLFLYLALVDRRIQLSLLRQVLDF